jgi:hypothetical protein
MVSMIRVLYVRGLAISNLLAVTAVCMASRTSELVKQFMEEPFSVALHPGGYSVLVGFPDKLRLFTILMDNLK